MSFCSTKLTQWCRWILRFIPFTYGLKLLCDAHKQNVLHLQEFHHIPDTSRVMSIDGYAVQIRLEDRLEEGGNHLITFYDAKHPGDCLGVLQFRHTAFARAGISEAQLLYLIKYRFQKEMTEYVLSPDIQDEIDKHLSRILTLLSKKPSHPRKKADVEDHADIFGEFDR